MINNGRTPSMHSLVKLAESIARGKNEEEIALVMETPEFLNLVTEEILKRWVSPSVRKFIAGIKEYIPGGLSTKQKIHLFNTYNSVKSRKKMW